MQTMNRPVYAEDVVAQEYARLSLTKRLMLRMVSRDMADAARHLSKHPRQHVDVPVFTKDNPGAFTRWVDSRLG